MLHTCTKFRGNRSTHSGEEDFEGVLPYMGWWPSWSCETDAVNKLSFPTTHRGSTRILALAEAVLEKTMFVHCVRRQTTTDAGAWVYYKLTW